MFVVFKEDLRGGTEMKQVMRNSGEGGGPTSPGPWAS